ncbi:MAG: nucleotidyltransferase family protein [Myxococcota bacterium]
MSADVAAVVLAAGASTRLGRPKQLLELEGETLVRRAARVALEAGCHPVVVVEGAVPLADALAGLAVERVQCVDWARGPGASLKAGLAQVRGRSVLVLLVDQPRVDVEDLRRLISAPGGVAAAEYDGVLGVPARFPGPVLDALERLPDERGAGPWLRAHADQVTPVPMPSAAEDIDTPDDAAALAAPGR